MATTKTATLTFRIDPHLKEALAGIFSSKAKQLPGEKQWESSR